METEPAVTFDLTPDRRTVEWRERIKAFLADVVIPREQEVFAKGFTDLVRIDLQKAARDAGIWAPQAPSDLGGGGFTLDQAAVLLEEAGTSLLGPVALNCAAPDEGNIHLLERIATGPQREAYLKPLVSGDIRSCFAMTEPPPGAGSDPAALRTRASRRRGSWVLNGRKHLITGAEGASFAIVMAAHEDTDGATMFLVEAGTPGWTIEGHTRTIDSTTIGGHCQVSLKDVVVADDAVLGSVGAGFQHAQTRLAPARLTHCMRWLGAARRAHSIALERAVKRQLFGSMLADLGMAQQMIADNEIDLAAARALLWQTSWQLARGARTTEESSRAKVFISEATARIVDRSVQLAGGMGTSDDIVIGRIYADIRAFRIYDGSSETHRMSIAKRAARRVVR